MAMEHSECQGMAAECMSEEEEAAREDAFHLDLVQLVRLPATYKDMGLYRGPGSGGLGLNEYVESCRPKTTLNRSLCFGKCPQGGLIAIYRLQ